MTYTPPSKPADPKPAMTDCTDMPDVIAATERGIEAIGAALSKETPK